jgi:hypothetical protein
MNKTSAIFIALLIISFSFCQKNILELIEKSAEGKNIFNSILMQTQLSGSFEPQAIRQVLQVLDSKLENIKNDIANNVNHNHEKCENSLKDLAGVSRDHLDRQLSLKNRLAGIKSLSESKKNALQRAIEEKQQYDHFLGYVDDALNRWKEFYGGVVSNHNHVLEILNQAQDTLKHLSESSGSAFIQLPNSYHLALTQVKVSFRGIENDLTGIRPVMENMLQIMQDSSAVSKAHVRGSLRNLFDHISETIKDRIDELEEVNSRQVNLYETLHLAFKDSSERSQKTIELLSDHNDHLLQKIDRVHFAFDNALKLSKQVDHIIELRTKQCHETYEDFHFSAISTEKGLHIISQINEILVTNSYSLSSYFLEKKNKLTS